MDNLPCFVRVKGEGSQHDEGTPGDRESKPSCPGVKFKRAIGAAPMPGGQTEKKDGRGKGIDSPKHQVKGRQS